MKKFKSASVTHRDTRISHGDLIFHPHAPGSLSVSVEWNGNALAAVYRIDGDMSCPEKPVDPALVMVGKNMLTFHPGCFDGCEENDYVYFRLVFSMGQNGQIPVYVQGRNAVETQQLFPLSEQAPMEGYTANTGVFLSETEDHGLGFRFDFGGHEYEDYLAIRSTTLQRIRIPRPRYIAVTYRGNRSGHAVSLRLYNRYHQSEVPKNEFYLDSDDLRTVYFELDESLPLPLTVVEPFRIRYSGGHQNRRGSLTVYSVVAMTHLPDGVSADVLTGDRISTESRFYSAEPTRIIRGVTEHPENTAVFSCIADARDCDLLYRKAGSEEPFSNAQHRIENGIELDGNRRLPIRYHKFDLTDLQPDSEYEYRIGSRSGSFRTFPEKPTEFHAMLISDVQVNTEMNYIERFGQVMAADAAMMKDPFLILSVGDLVAEEDDMAEMDALYHAGEAYFAQYPFAPAPGNHERDESNLYTTYQHRFAVPAGQRGDGLLYTVHIGAYDLISVCADSGDITEKELNEIENELNASKAKWKIVFLHASPYTGKGTPRAYRRILAPVLQRGGADVVLSGHSHIYVRASVWDDKPVDTADGVLYLTIGMDGRRAFTNYRAFWQDYVYGDCREQQTAPDGLTDLTCAVAHFRPDRLEFEIRTLSGIEVDRIVLEK